MKISTGQLKQLIREVIGRDSLTDDIASDMMTKIADTWSSMYDDSDLTMYAYGPKAWDKQVEEACAELELKLSDLVKSVETKLINGDYF